MHIQGKWNDILPQQYKNNMALKEIIPVRLMLEQAAPQYKNRIVVVTLDNISAVMAILKGSSKSAIVNEEIIRLYDLAHQFNILLLADWIPRSYNDYCDQLSKYKICIDDKSIYNH